MLKSSWFSVTWLSVRPFCRWMSAAAADISHSGTNCTATCQSAARLPLSSSARPRGVTSSTVPLPGASRAAEPPSRNAGDQQLRRAAVRQGKPGGVAHGKPRGLGQSLRQGSFPRGGGCPPGRTPAQVQPGKGVRLQPAHRGGPALQRDAAAGGKAALPGGAGHLRPGGDKIGGVCVGHGKPAVPVAGLAAGLLGHALQIHIGQAEHDRHQKHPQQDAQPGHAALAAVYPG